MTAEQAETELFQAMIVRALEQEVTPFYEQWEEAGKIPRPLWHTLGQAGMLGIDMPEEYGGAAASFEVSQLAIEEIDRMGFGGLASGYNIHANIVMPYKIGRASCRERW